MRPYGYWVFFGEWGTDTALDLRRLMRGNTSNIASTRDAITPLYGTSGGVENFGMHENPKGSGTITVNLGIKPRVLTRYHDPLLYMQELISVKRRLRRGSQRLWYAPRGTDDPQQWLYTYAKCTQIEERNDITNAMFTDLQVSFTIEDPHLYGRRTASDWYFDSSSYMDGTLSFDAESANLSVGTEVSVYNAGTADALPAIWFNRNGGTLGNFVFQRITDSMAEQSFTYAGTLQSGNDELIVLPALHWASDLANFTAGQGQQVFMSIPPGYHTLKLLSASTLTGTPVLYYDFEYAWH